MSPRKYSFFYHYNKPASKVAGKNKLTLHWRKQCILVDKIFCNVNTRTMDRKRQPHCVVKGQAEILNIATKLNGETWAELSNYHMLGNKNE